MKLRLLRSLTVVAVLAGGLSGLVGGDPVSAAELVPNGGFEVSSSTNPALPASWNGDYWGTNTSLFSSPATGAHGGSRSARIDVSAFVSGGAKWSFAPQPAIAGGKYQLSTWYRSNVVSQLLALYTKTDGTTQFQWLADPIAATSWTNATIAFTAPAAVSTVTIFHLIASAGYLEIDDMSLTDSAPVVPPTSLGIVPNGNVESASSTNSALPANWSQVSSGTNTAAFSWPTGGAHSGNKSLRIDTTSFTSGGATWAFDPQPVTVGSSYKLDTWYSSTSKVEFLAVYTTAAGGTSSQLLADVNPTAAWTNFTSTFTAPAGVTKLTIYSTALGVGVTSIDDVSVTAVAVTPPPPPPPPTTGIIPNGGFEVGNTASPQGPVNWNKVQWGKITAAFSWPTGNAHSGTKSAQINVSSVSSGAAATWAVDAQPLVANKAYDFSGWYKGTVGSEILAVYTTTTNTTSYQLLGNVGPQASWTQYRTQFTTPANVAKVTVFQSVTSVGTLSIDDVSLGLYAPKALTRPLVSVTYDDGEPSAYSVGFAKMQAKALPATFFIISGQYGHSGEITAAQVQQMSLAGEEIGSHSVTHTDLTTMTSAQQDVEINQSQATLQALIGKPVTDFASPYGAYNDAIRAKLMAKYSSHRTIDSGYNYRDTMDLSRLKARMVLSTTTLAEVQGWINQAKADNSWLILVFHDLRASPPSIYDTTPTLHNQMIDALAASGVAVKTIADARAEIAPQI